MVTGRVWGTREAGLKPPMAANITGLAEKAKLLGQKQDLCTTKVAPCLIVLVLSFKCCGAIEKQSSY
jgi:hypothetical protein